MTLLLENLEPICKRPLVVKQDSLPRLKRSYRVANASNDTGALESKQVFVLGDNTHCYRDILSAS